LEETPITNKTVIKPEKKPTTGKVNIPSKVEVKPVIMTVATPSVAPAETPMVYEDANGFCRTDCITTPLADNAAPTKKAVKVLGILISHRIDTKDLSTASGIAVPVSL
jgi:hypothetical protein